MILVLAWAPALQSRGLERRSGRDGGTGAQDRRVYNPRTVTTFQGQGEYLVGYGMQGWRVAPAMEIRGLVLKTKSAPPVSGSLGLRSLGLRLNGTVDQRRVPDGAHG
jgi:hypothetical protein